MRRLLYICVFVLSAMSLIAENHVTNVRAEQVEHTIVITYDLSKTANVRLLMAMDMLNNFQELKQVTGAVGKNVQAGTKRTITWNVLEEFDSFNADGVRFKVETYGAEYIGVFSVSSSKKVIFSKGNLQYHPTNNKWRFAEKQWDYIGDANRNISSTYNGWLDLFGWGTGSSPTNSSMSAFYYQNFVDWVTNQIGNDIPNTWRTLTNNEWDYLLDTRNNASSLKGVAQVNGVNGLILLPDDWTCPSNVPFKSGFHNSYAGEYFAAYQTFTADQWSELEAAGAVFLPASGNRNGTTVSNVQESGYYWSTTESSNNYAYCLYFLSDEAHIGSYFCGRGQSVRLVKEL